MHRIFHIPELVSQISRLLGYPADGEDGGNHQFKFALSCKAVWEVAVVELWRSVVDADRFCRLLPEDILACIGNDDKIVLRRPLEAVEWRRLLKYSQHVRQLVLFDYVWGDKVNHSIESPHLSLFAAALASRPEGMRVFPSLGSLKLVSSLQTDDSVSVATCLFQLPVADLEVDLSGGNTSRIKQALGAIPPHPGLESLHINWSSSSTGDEKLSEDGERNAVLADLVRRLPNLRRLCIPICMPDNLAGALLPAASLTKLEDLTVSVDIAQALSPLVLPAAFPCLTALAIDREFTQHSAKLLVKLLQYVTSNSLARFRFSCENLVALQTPLQIVVEKWASSLVALDLSLGLSKKGYTGKVLHFDPLLPLAECHSIQSVRIESIDPLEILDSHYDTITSAWPELRGLCIYEQTWKEPDAGPRTSKAGRRSLLYLASRCPKVRSLSISINFDKGASLKPPKAGTRACQLESFHSVWSSSTQMDSAVAFIQKTFPHLRFFDALNVDGFDVTKDGQDRCMDEIKEALDLPEIGEP